MLHLRIAAKLTRTFTFQARVKQLSKTAEAVFLSFPLYYLSPGR